MFGRVVALAAIAAKPIGISAEQTPDFTVRFTVVPNPTASTEEETFDVEVFNSWTEHGSSRFRELVESKFYDNTRFFRVIPTFMAQFGLNGDPEVNKEWRGKPIKDDPVVESNKPGYITFAKTGAPDSRTTQLFINYADNANLDGMGFAPFGRVTGDGMTVVRKIYNCGEKPNQGYIQQQGNDYLDEKFPDLGRIVKVEVVGSEEI